MAAPRAAADLRDARKWLLQPGSGPSARARWEALLEACRHIRTIPQIGKPDPDLAGCRSVIVSGYRIVYRLVGSNDGVEILRVFRPGQLGSML